MYAYQPMHGRDIVMSDFNCCIDNGEYLMTVIVSVTSHKDYDSRDV